SACAQLYAKSILRNSRLLVDTRGQVLDADTVYEARLSPLLFHEDFSAYPLGLAAGPRAAIGRWAVQAKATTPFRWEVGEVGEPPSRHITQSESYLNLPCILSLGKDPNLANDHPDQPDVWDDYRLSVYFRMSGEGSVGVTFRDRPDGHYLYVMDRRAGRRRLE